MANQIANAATYNAQNDANENPSQASAHAPPSWGGMEKILLWAMALSLVVLALAQNNSALAQNNVDTASQPSAVFKESILSQSSGEDHAAQNPAPDKTPQDIYAQIIPPTNGLELLANIRFLVKHDLLLRKDFYITENLKKVLGADQVKLGTVPGNGIRAKAPTLT